MKDINDEVITSVNQPTRMEETDTLQTVPSETNKETKQLDFHEVIDVEDRGMKDVMLKL